ncbi:MAG: endonuclease/exonuclease/phosphatase family protein, partial [Clostridiales bacterium]|nr:endonuclease/exonuclease/phosphatase family protein [Clostridiales bacterium]
FYPFSAPHGKSLSGMLTLSRFDMTESVRRSLPIEESLMKFVDLDRCYSVSRVEVSNGRELVLYTAHLSAYTSDGLIAEEQLRMLLDDMESEYNNGNYCICGGDFNKDLLGDSSKIFGISSDGYTWAQPFPESMVSGRPLAMIAPFDENNPIPSCRNADGPHNPGQFVVTVDGFIASDNIEIVSSRVIDTGFVYSDHNPVELRFVMK